MDPLELQNNCALCGKLIEKSSDLRETIGGRKFRFDTSDCAVMFKRLLSVYGDDFKQFLGNEQFISDPFWDRVIPREDEIDEIREEEERQQYVRKTGHQQSEFVKTIKDPKEIQELSNQLIKSARDDIEVTISSASIFHQLQEQAPGRGFHLHSLREIAAANTTIDIKVLTPPGEEIKTVLSKLRHDPLQNIQNRYIDDVSSLHRKIILLVVDRKFSLAIKFKGEEYFKEASKNRTTTTTTTTKENILEKAIESATYSTNKSTVLSYVTIFESLWKELELNEQITNIFEKLKNQEGMRREFLTTAAHELRAPIQPVLGLAQVLLSKKNVDTKEQEELLTIIIRNARRLKALTENILDLTRIESQSLKLHKETFNLDNMIGDLITDTKSQPTNEKKKVNIRYDNRGQRKEEDAVNLFVEADRARLIQVISNLLNNAIKFSKTGTVLVNLEKKVKSKEVIVCINDDGPGIDPTILPKLFEKFATKSDKGIGLGLFISKTIIEAHNGRIWAENNPDGNGAAFSFSLPIY